MTYVTRGTGYMPTAWKEPEDCVDEWARVKEMRKNYNSPLRPLNPVLKQGEGRKGLSWRKPISRDN